MLPLLLLLLLLPPPSLCMRRDARQRPSEFLTVKFALRVFVFPFTDGQCTCTRQGGWVSFCSETWITQDWNESSAVMLSLRMTSPPPGSGSSSFGVVENSDLFRQRNVIYCGLSRATMKNENRVKKFGDFGPFVHYLKIVLK
jgi:hypothetical protein